jgi:hypothetical protein
MPSPTIFFVLRVEFERRYEEKSLLDLGVVPYAMMPPPEFKPVLRKPMREEKRMNENTDDLGTSDPTASSSPFPLSPPATAAASASVATPLSISVSPSSPSSSIKIDSSEVNVLKLVAWNHLRHITSDINILARGVGAASYDDQMNNRDHRLTHRPVGATIMESHYGTVEERYAVVKLLWDSEAFQRRLFSHIIPFFDAIVYDEPDSSIRQQMRDAYRGGYQPTRRQ